MIRNPSRLAAIADLNRPGVWSSPAVFAGRGELCGLIGEDFDFSMDILKGAVWRHSGGANIGMGDGHVEFRHARSIPKLGGDDPFWFYTK